MKTCKCCGQTLPLDRPAGLRLSGMDGVIFDSVRRAGKHGVNSDMLFDAIYANDRNGGPASGIHIISCRVSRLNKKLFNFNLKIKGEHPGRGGCGIYRLLPL